jgi:hypothetical protein
LVLDRASQRVRKAAVQIVDRAPPHLFGRAQKRRAPVIRDDMPQGDPTTHAERLECRL